MVGYTNASLFCYRVKTLKKDNNKKSSNSSRASERRSKPRDNSRTYHVISARDEELMKAIPAFLEEFGYPVEPLANRPGSERQCLMDALDGTEGYFFPNDLVDLELLSGEWYNFSIDKGLNGTPLLAKVHVARGKSSVSRLIVGRT